MQKIFYRLIISIMIYFFLSFIFGWDIIIFPQVIAAEAANNIPPEVIPVPVFDTWSPAEGLYQELQCPENRPISDAIFNNRTVNCLLISPQNNLLEQISVHNNTFICIRLTGVINNYPELHLVGTNNVLIIPDSWPPHLITGPVRANNVVVKY